MGAGWLPSHTADVQISVLVFIAIRHWKIIELDCLSFLICKMGCYED